MAGGRHSNRQGELAFLIPTRAGKPMLSPQSGTHRAPQNRDSGSTRFDLAVYCGPVLAVVPHLPPTDVALSSRVHSNGRCVHVRILRKRTPYPNPCCCNYQTWYGGISDCSAASGILVRCPPSWPGPSPLPDATAESKPLTTTPAT